MLQMLRSPIEYSNGLIYSGGLPSSQSYQVQGGYNGSGIGAIPGIGNNPPVTPAGPGNVQIDTPPVQITNPINTAPVQTVSTSQTTNGFPWIIAIVGILFFVFLLKGA